jgi:hypothetical protein
MGSASLAAASALSSDPASNASLAAFRYSIGKTRAIQ